MGATKCQTFLIDGKEWYYKEGLRKWAKIEFKLI